MSSNDDELARKLAQFMREADGPREPYVWTDDEVEKMKAVIAFVEKVRMLRGMGRWVMYVVVALGTLAINWERAKEWLGSFFIGS